MNINKEFFQSKLFKKSLYVIGALVVAFAIFNAGVFVGYHKAGFSYKYGDNYSRAFGGRRSGMMGFGGRGGMMGDYFTNSRGVAGKIVSISLPTMVVSGQDGVEKIVLIKEDTEIREFRNTIKSEELKAGNFVVVMGVPNEQLQIEAKLIRIMPADIINTANTLPKN